jgi:hypothetical protein
MLYSPTLAHPFEVHNALRIAHVEESVCLSGVNQALVELKSQGGQPDASGASLVYAGYPYDPCA